MPPFGILTHRLSALIAMAAITVVLAAACSVDESLEPEPTATPTAVAFEPGDVAVGTLLQTSREAWDDVDAWTAKTLTTTASGDGVSSTATETVILPDSRHVISMNGDTVVAEEIVVGDRIYMRGTLVSSSIYPDVGPETWIGFRPDQAPEDTVLEQRVDYLTTPAGFPFADITESTRALPAKPVGETQVEERTCTAYRFTTTTPEQEGLDYQISFDANDRPCQLVREGGGVVETTTWIYPDTAEPITAPAEVTPVEQFPSSIS